MHLSEGILSPPVLVAGGVIAALAVAAGLRRIRDDEIPRVAVLSAAFFVASLIHVPLGPTSVHLVLNGLCGLVLGWRAAPAIFIALTLQAILFGFGGLTTLGVNTTLLALPAVLTGLAGRAMLRRSGTRWVAPIGGLVGVASIALSAALVALALAASHRSFTAAAALLFAAHAPVFIVEGVVTGAMARFLFRVRPEILGLQAAADAGD